jgi:hypothetical protein
MGLARGGLFPPGPGQGKGHDKLQGEPCCTIALRPEDSGVNAEKSRAEGSDESGAVTDLSYALQSRSTAFRVGRDSQRLDPLCQRYTLPQIVGEVKVWGLSNCCAVRALVAREPSPPDEPFDLSLTQCNGHAAHSVSPSCAVATHAAGGRRKKRLFCARYRHRDPWILSHPSCT